MPSAHPITEYIGPATWSLIEAKFSDYAKDALVKVIDFVETECIPAERTFHAQISHDPVKRWQTIPPIMEELKAKAKGQGLWNLFLSKRHYPKHGVPLTTLEYGVMCEVLGRSTSIAPQAMNCSAPDTGNMEVLAKYGVRLTQANKHLPLLMTFVQNPAQQEKWLKPLMEGKIRSCFAMTEKGKSSSDAKNISATIIREGDHFVINAHKQWSSGAGDPRNALYVLVGKTDPTNPNTAKQQSVVLVPADSPGITLIRPLTIFGYDDAPEGHFEVKFENVRVPVGNLVAGYGRGFEVLQGRLGPGRIHHCMRALGVASRGLDLMLERATDPKRKTFGKNLSEHGTVVADIAKMRIEIDQTRFLVLSAANAMDNGDAKSAMKEISEAKIATFVMCQQVLDRAIQIHGGEGMDQQLPLAQMWAHNRTLRFADGPDEVHMGQLGKIELKRAPGIRTKHEAQQVKSEELLKARNLQAHL